MSIFTSADLACPACGAVNAFEAVASVNADRRADLRRAILEGTFQRQPCVGCGRAFRLDTDFVYVELKRRHWIAARPVSGFDRWPGHEAEARAVFDAAYGPGAPAAVRALAGETVPRLVFGWPALREKLIAAEAGLDDTVLELLKMAMLRNLPETPFAADTTLRLIGVADDGALVTAWVANPDDATTAVKGVPRELYDAIAADAADPRKSPWGAALAAFADALFVDVDRLMIAGTPLAA
jgi:hypothetical protein